MNNFNPIKLLIDVWWARPYLEYTFGHITMGQLIKKLLFRFFVSALVIAACGAIVWGFAYKNHLDENKKFGITDAQIDAKHALMKDDKGHYDPNYFAGRKDEEDEVDMKIFGKLMGNEHSANYGNPKDDTPTTGAASSAAEVMSRITQSEVVAPITQAVKPAETPSPSAQAAATPEVKVPEPVQVAASPWPHADKPGFNCSAAHSAVEHMICDNQELIDADAQMSKQYSQMDRTDDNLEAQKAWIKERNICNTVECVKKSYTYRLKELM